MASKSIFKKETTNSSGFYQWESPPIPDGERWMLIRIGFSSNDLVKLGLFWGGNQFREIVVKAGTVDFELNREFTGDGVSKLKLGVSSIGVPSVEFAMWLDATRRG